MSDVLDTALSLDEYIYETHGSKGPEKVTMTVSCDTKVETDGFRRLRKTVENLNRNIKKCGLEILDSEGKWVDVASEEEMSQINIPLPEGLSNIEKLKAIHGYVVEARERLGGLAFDIAENTGQYNQL
jgi:hypothetical protein